MKDGEKVTFEIGENFKDATHVAIENKNFNEIVNTLNEIPAKYSRSILNALDKMCIPIKILLPEDKKKVSEKKSKKKEIK